MRKYLKSRLDIYQIVVSLRILLRNYHLGRQIMLNDLESWIKKLEKCFQLAIKSSYMETEK